MNANFRFRQEILDRLGSPEPELPGVTFIGNGSKANFEVVELFDRMCMQDVHDRAVFEAAIAKLEDIRGRDYQAFYLGRSELLCMYPVVHEVPDGP